MNLALKDTLRTNIPQAASRHPTHLTHASAAGWTFWRDCVLRSAGLPADRMAALAQEPLGRSADALLQARSRTAVLLAEAAQALGRNIDTLRTKTDANEPNSDSRTLKSLQRAIKSIRQRLLSPEAHSELGTDAAQAIEAALAEESALQAAFDTLYACAEAQTSRVISEQCQDPWLREAVTWQNHSAVESALLPLAEGRPMTGTRRRQREALVANYLQRYALKNDTIGFFGPITWARIEPEAGVARCAMGSGLLRRREVRFEDWPIDALAQLLAQNEAVFGELVPRMHPFLEFDGGRLRLPGGATAPLSAREAAVIRRCDGLARCRDIAQRLLADPFGDFDSEQDVFAVLRALRDKDRLWIGFPIPDCDPRPELALRASLARVEPGQLRDTSIASLDDLCASRDAVAAAAGDALALREALLALDKGFESLTGVAVRRRPGEAYGGRALVYEDCHRDLDIRLSEASLAPIRGALDHVLQSARWFTSEAGRLFHERFLELHAEQRARGTAPDVPFADFWLHAQTLLFADGASVVAPLGDELRLRWQSLLGRTQSVSADGRRCHVDSRDLVSDIAATFPPGQAGWTMARHQCPDLMFCAADADALLSGDYLAVLGEVHIGGNTLATNLFVSQHPRPEALRDAVRSDLSAPYVCPKLSSDASATPIRTQWIDDPEQCGEILFSHGVVPANPATAVDIGELRLRVDAMGKLQVRHRDGGWEAPLLDVVGDFLFLVVLNQFGVVERRPYTPRITIDRLVVQRERWAFSMTELAQLVTDKSGTDGAAFIATRHWQAANALPTRVFVKVAWEDKPFFLDFDSPVLVRHFVKQLRGADAQTAGRPVVLTEMLPDFDQLWLQDANGRRYTSEFRVVCAHVDDVATPSPATFPEIDVR